MRSFAALLIGVLLVVSVVSGVGAGYPGETPAHPSSAQSVSPELASDASTALPDSPATLTGPPNDTNTSSNVTVRDGTEMYVSLHENGNARWNVTARFVLRDENETAAFRELATDYESGSANVGFTRATFERVVEHAARDTDRPMRIRNVSRVGSVRQNGSVGVLSLSFTWTNFTHVEDGQIVLGDVFWVDSETWLPSLTADQTLVIEAPGGYYVLSSNVGVDGARVRYDGPYTFDSGDFSITYAPKQTSTTTTTDPGGFDFSSTSGLVIVLFLFGLGGFGAYAAAQRRGPDPDPVEETESVDRSAPAPTTAGTDTEDAADGEAVTKDGEDEDDEPPMELLSDEERVLRLLRENDGRMKQAQIVKETNWSNAKVSQLLSKMNDDDAVDKLRIGRENLITLPDEDVTDVD